MDLIPMCVGKLVPRAVCHWNHLGRLNHILMPRSCISAVWASKDANTPRLIPIRSSIAHQRTEGSAIPDTCSR